MALPGCQKRDKFSIKDDQKFYNKKNEGYFLKVMRDHNTSVKDILTNKVSIIYIIDNLIAFKLQVKC